MYPWRSLQHTSRCIRTRHILLAQEHLSLVLKISGRGSFHISSSTSKSKPSGYFKTHSPMPHWWCESCCIDVKYVDIPRECIRTQPLGYLALCQSQSLSSWIDLCVLLQCIIVRIRHFGCDLVRSHSGATGRVGNTISSMSHIPLWYNMHFCSVVPFSNSHSPMHLFNIFIYIKMNHCCMSVWWLWLIPGEKRHEEGAHCKCILTPATLLFR